MDIQSKKLELIDWILQLQDEAKIREILRFKNKSKAKISEEEQKAINEGIEDFEKGNVIDHIEVKKHYEKWL